MKKEIVIIALLLTSTSAFSQGKLDGSGSLLPEYRVVQSANTAPIDQAKYENAVFDGNGTLKAGATLPLAPIQSNLDESPNANFNASGSIGNEAIVLPVVNNVSPVLVAQEVYVRKQAKDLVDLTNGITETYTRKSNQDISVDYSNGVKETYVRELSLQSPITTLPQAQVRANETNKPEVASSNAKPAIDKASSVYGTSQSKSVIPILFDPKAPSSISNTTKKNSAIESKTSGSAINQKSSTDR